MQKHQILLQNTRKTTLLDMNRRKCRLTFNSNALNLIVGFYHFIFGLKL